MIRLAVEEDIPRLVEMGRRFRHETSYDKYLSENPEKMAELGQKLIAGDGLLLSEQDGNITGMLGFIVHDHFISGERTAGEVFWWVEPERRGDGLRLLKEMERRSILAGATKMQMIAPTEKVANLYERFGYDFVESTYQKSLGFPLIFDNFAPDAEQVREAVIAGEFSTQTGPDGAQYTGISQFQVPHWFDRLSTLLGQTIKPKISCFRMNLAGELPHSWVHSDDICAQYASVLYLNPPEQCEGGTAFWRHKELNIDRLPTREQLESSSVNADEFYASMNAEWKVLSSWERTNFIPMKWNRFITYPTCLFHSRYPFEGFGVGPKDGRLIWVCFYDLEAA